MPYKAKVLPRLRCLHCGASWRRNAKKKLSPSRNCPQCFRYLKVEGEDYSWDDLGNFEFQYAENILKVKESGKRGKPELVLKQQRNQTSPSGPPGKDSMSVLHSIMSPSIDKRTRKLLDA